MLEQRLTVIMMRLIPMFYASKLQNHIRHFLARRVAEKKKKKKKKSEKKKKKDEEEE